MCNYEFKSVGVRIHINVATTLCRRQSAIVTNVALALARSAVTGGTGGLSGGRARSRGVPGDRREAVCRDRQERTGEAWTSHSHG